MNLTRRAYAGEPDKQQMSALVHAAPSDNLHSVDLPYRLSSWAFDVPENVGLWDDEAGELRAWTVMQTPFWAIDYACHPAMETSNTYLLLLSWADIRAQEAVNTPHGRPMWFVNVREDQKARIAALEAAGFTCQANVPENPWSKVFMAHRDRPATTACSLPPGILIRPLAGEQEVEAYVKLHRSVFGSTSMTREWRTRVLQRPEYVPDLDLVAVTAEGRLAAFCVCWFDEVGRGGRPSGQIEPLGVHAEFRGQGLGRAILTEGLRRLYLQGAEQVFVETDHFRDAAYALYQSVGFRVAQNILVYRKDYQGL